MAQKDMRNKGKSPEEKAAERENPCPAPGTKAGEPAATWAEDAQAELEDFIEAQGIYIRQ